MGCEAFYLLSPSCPPDFEWAWRLWDALLGAVPRFTSPGSRAAGKRLAGNYFALKLMLPMKSWAEGCCRGPQTASILMEILGKGLFGLRCEVPVTTVAACSASINTSLHFWALPRLAVFFLLCSACQVFLRLPCVDKAPLKYLCVQKAGSLLPRCSGDFGGFWLFWSGEK